MDPFISKKLKIKTTKSSGRGVFANIKIEKGEIIEISPLIIIPFFDLKKLNKTIISYYWYFFTKKECAIGLGLSSLYNHSDDNNSEFVILNKFKMIKIIATKEIKKGEEVRINYGYDVRKHNIKKFFLSNKKVRPTSGKRD